MNILLFLGVADLEENLTDKQVDEFLSTANKDDIEYLETQILQGIQTQYVEGFIHGYLRRSEQ